MNNFVFPFAALVFSCFAGCASAPSASNFEAFARQHAETLSGKKLSHDGQTYDVNSRLDRFDLIRTDSVINPFVGTAVYMSRINAPVLRHDTIDGYETPAVYLNVVTVSWGWREGSWHPMTAVIECKAIGLPELSEEHHASIVGSIKYPSPITIEDPFQISEGNTWNLYWSSSGTIEDFKKSLRSKP